MIKYRQTYDWLNKQTSETTSYYMDKYKDNGSDVIREWRYATYLFERSSIVCLFPYLTILEQKLLTVRVTVMISLYFNDSPSVTSTFIFYFFDFFDIETGKISQDDYLAQLIH